MKKNWIAIVALLCAGVVLCASVMTLGVMRSESLLDADSSVIASTLADGSMPATAVAPSNDKPLPSGYTKWDGTVSDGFASGTGKRDDPFLISTPEEFAFLILACKQYSADENGTPYYTAHYRVTQDLVFNDDFTINGTTIDEGVKAGLKAFSGASPTTDFGGTINGDGHILYNLYVPYEGTSGAMSAGTGLFGQVSGTIMDLHLVRGYMNGIDQSTKPGGGTFARELTGTLDGCSSGMTYSFRGGNGAGGLVGRLKNPSAAKTASIKNCTFTGYLHVYGNSGARASDGTGGILGMVVADNYTKSMTVTDCINKGVVESSGKYIGGIVGKVHGSHEAKPNDYAFARCLNYGRVQSTYIIPVGNDSAGSCFVGGILGGAGYLSESVSGTSYHMEYCANFGTVAGQESSIGGLVGGHHFQSNSTANPMTFYSCYSLGYVLDEAPDGARHNYGGKYIGGLVGTPRGPVEVYDSIVGGIVRGNDGVGGIVGRLSSDNEHQGSGKSNLKISASHIMPQVSGTSNVGGIIGIYMCGNSQTNTTFELTGTFMEGTVTAKTMVGGLIGGLEKNKGSTLATLNLSYSVMDVRVEKTTDIGRMGILIGASTVGCVPTLVQTEFYASSSAYNLASGTPVKVEDVKVMQGLSSLSLSKLFVDDNLKNGTYLSRLEFGAAIDAATAKWVTSSITKKPVHQNVERLQTLALSRAYDGLATKLEHTEWLGVTPVCGWEKWDGSQWVTIDEAPRDVGRYRVSAALLSPRAAGAAIVEFEISKKQVDFAKLKWGGELAPVYTGDQFIMELSGVPAGVTVTYENSRKIDAGTYVAHFVSAVDTSGNYDIINTDAVQDQPWQIQSATLDMQNVDWNTNSLEYNEEEQSVFLIDKTDTNRDLAKLLNIVYAGNTATNAGTGYLATAEVSYNPNNVQVANRSTSYEQNWEITRRVIRPWTDIRFVGGTMVDGALGGLSIVYDAREHTLLWDPESFPDCVEVTIDTTVTYTNVGKYTYPITFAFKNASDTDNNVFALEKAGAPGTFIETEDTTITGVRYLIIEKATPKIYGAISQDTTYISWDPEKLIVQPDNSVVADQPHTFAIGIQYNQDKTIRYDETTGEEIPTLFVDMDGIADLRAELARYSNYEYFTVEYYLQTKELDDDGNVVSVKERLVKNDYGNRPYNAGTYKAVVTYHAPADSNFTDATATATLIINPATYELPLNIVMLNEQVDEDGDEHILHLQYEDTLPSYITPVYTCNGTQNYPYKPGKYLFQVDFVFSEEMEPNYQPLRSMQAYLTIVTKTLHDTNTGVSLTFKDSTYMRLLINERTDTDSFVTDWAYGYDTALKSLYQIELKEELSNVWVLENSATLRLPLTEEMAKSEMCRPVYITIDEKGNFTIEEIDTFIKEAVWSKDALPTYLEFSVDRVGYYGIITSTEDSPHTQGRMMWLIASVCLVPPAALLITLSLLSRRRKNKSRRED